MFLSRPPFLIFTTNACLSCLLLQPPENTVNAAITRDEYINDSFTELMGFMELPIFDGYWLILLQKFCMEIIIIIIKNCCP